MLQPNPSLLFLFITVIIYSPFLSSGAQLPFDIPSANIKSKWINNGESIKQTDCWIMHFYQFSIFIGNLNAGRGYAGSPAIVWSANRSHPVRGNATLEFSKDGDLLLGDFDGTQVWSTNTSGKSVVGMKLNEVGSLLLYDNKNQTVWSSLDHPTDRWVLGQTLRPGQRLTANVFSANSTQGLFHLSIVSGGFKAFFGSQVYYNGDTHN